MIPYTPKQNKRPVGFEVLITAEPHTVGIVGVATVMMNMIKLVEVPRQNIPSSVSIPGYTETSLATPGNGQFFVDYSNGYITFNPLANGNSVFVTYYGRGSEVDAVDINELQEPVGIALDLDGTVTPNALIFGIVSLTNPSGTLPQTDIDNHTGIIVIATSSVIVSIPSPTDTTEGRFFTILNSSTSTQDITINWTNPGINSVNVAIGSGVAYLWDGLVWILVAGGGGGFPVFASDPSTPFLGQTYFNSTNHQFLGWSGSAWVILG